jgi:5-methylcytosine-specific restriction protein A
MAWHALYGSRWRRARLAFLLEHPLCIDPFRRHANPEPATVVDHRKPHRGDKELFWDTNNWQSLCLPCNSIKAATEERG